MPYPFVTRYLPTRESMREHRLFRVWGHRLLEPDLALTPSVRRWRLFYRPLLRIFAHPYTNARGRIDGADRPMQHRAFGRRHMGYQPVNHGSYVFLRL